MAKVSKIFLIIIIAIIILIIIIAVYLLTNRLGPGGLDLSDCRDFPGSFGSQHECKAQDDGKKCFFDDECIKNNCVYPQLTQLNDNHEFTGDQTVGGKCDSFLSDNDGVTQCHRKRGENVKCDWYIS